MDTIMQARCNILILLLTLCFFNLVFSAKDAGSDSGKTETEKVKKFFHRTKILPLPVLFYRPETSLAFGAQVKTIFRTGKNKEFVRPSTVVPEIIYTLKNQFITRLKSDFYLAENGWHLFSFLDFRTFPDQFYGIGNWTESESEEAYSSRSGEIHLGGERYLGFGFHLGVHYHLNNWKLTEKEPGGLLDSGSIPGSSGGTASGLGMQLIYDTRDHIFYPRKGEWFSIRFTFYQDFLGSSFDFSDLIIDLRKYISLAGENVLAFQALLKTQSGDVPFNLLGQLGGSYLLRGYYAGRFRDKHLLVLQAEWRCPIFWRIGFSLFAGAGQVADRLGHLDLGNFNYSLGIGLRLLFNKKESINARMDGAWGTQSSGIYMEGDESF